jgi:Protein of unknown function (DUF4236)
VGWVYRRRVRLGRNAWLNISKRGVSESVRVGPVTFNSRGRRSVRVAKGLSYRSGCALPLLLSGLTAAAAVRSIAGRRSV